MIPFLEKQVVSLMMQGMARTKLMATVIRHKSMNKGEYPSSLRWIPIKGIL